MSANLDGKGHWTTSILVVFGGKGRWTTTPGYELSSDLTRSSSSTPFAIRQSQYATIALRLAFPENAPPTSSTVRSTPMRGTQTSIQHFTLDASATPIPSSNSRSKDDLCESNPLAKSSHYKTAKPALFCRNTISARNPSRAPSPSSAKCLLSAFSHFPSGTCPTYNSGSIIDLVPLMRLKAIHGQACRSGSTRGRLVVTRPICPVPNDSAIPRPSKSYLTCVVDRLTA